MNNIVIDKFHTVIDIFQIICKAYEIDHYVESSAVLYLGSNMSVHNGINYAIKNDKIRIYNDKIFLVTNALSKLYSYIYVHKEIIPCENEIGDVYNVTNVLAFFKIMETYYTNVDSFKENKNVIFNKTTTALIKDKLIQSRLDEFISTNYFYVSFFYLILSDELKAKYEHIDNLKSFELFNT
jgi:hypothetical protein